MKDRRRVLEEEEFDVITVGAGIGGLVASALLARKGKRVLVLDKHSVAGGHATVFKRKGYEFDIGVHYLGECDPDGVIPRLLHACGADVEFEQLDPGGYDTLLFPNLAFKIPRGVERFRERLVETFPAEKRGIDRYIKILRQLQLLEKSWSSPWRFVKALPRVLSLCRWYNATFEGFLRTCTADPRLKAVLTAQNLTYALPPSRASLLMGLGVTSHYLRGAYYPKGGGQVIADRLVEAIERNGGKILLRAAARRVLITGREVRGVEFDSAYLGRRVVRASVVISNADLKHTVRDLVGAGHLRRRTVTKVEGYEMSPAVGVAYIGLRGSLDTGGSRTNYYVFPETDVEPAYAAVSRGEFHPRPFVYVTSASLKDPTNPNLAPPGISNVIIMALAPSSPGSWGVTAAEVESGEYRKSEAYQRKKDEYVDALLTTTERAIPDIRERIAHLELSTPLTNVRFTGASGGTAFGIAALPEQFVFHRPGASTDVKGLYLCGASCRAGTGIVGVSVSGLLAAVEVVGYRLIGEVMGNAAAPPRSGVAEQPDYHQAGDTGVRR